MSKTFKVIETLAYRNVVNVKANNKEEAWSKAFEGGEMSVNGECEDIVQQNVDIQEQSQ